MQKTAYEWRIRDGSSDACSSDLAFQEGAENPRFDLGPDMLTGLDQHFKLFGIGRDRGAFLEQVAVELLQRHTECGGKLALVHRRPQRGKLVFQDRKSTRLNSSH